MLPSFMVSTSTTKMNDFNADCTINLLISGQGRPAKLAWACSVTLRDGQRLVLARKFVGIVSREKLEWEAALFGIQQATRLQQEKVALSFDANLSGINQPAGPKLKDPALQVMREEAEFLWAGFRLRKAARLDEKEAAFLKEESEKAFRRPKK